MPGIATIKPISSTPSGEYWDFEERNRRDHAKTLTSGNGWPGETISPQWNCTTSPVLTWGDADNNGSGITITNGDVEWRGFFIYHNKCDYSPWKYIWISPGATHFVSLPALFEGRIVRGSDEVSIGQLRL